MKKIKKIDPTSAQSVYSFACPCLDGVCSACYACACGGGLQQTGFNGAKTAIAMTTQHGTQTFNYS